MKTNKLKLLTLVFCFMASALWMEIQGSQEEEFINRSTKNIVTNNVVDGLNVRLEDIIGSFSNNNLYEDSYGPDSGKYSHFRYLLSPNNPQWQSLSFSLQTGGEKHYFELVNGERIKILHPGTYRINATACFNHWPKPYPGGQLDPSLQVQLGISLNQNNNIIQHENNFRTLKDNSLGINRMPYYHVVDCNVTSDVFLNRGDTIGLSVFYNVFKILVGLEKLTIKLIREM